MLTNAYTLYDNKSLTYSPPFFAVAHGAAARLVADLASDLQTSVGRHPADYVLFCIGVFDDASGRLLPNDVREHITDVTTLVPGPSVAKSGNGSLNL